MPDRKFTLRDIQVKVSAIVLTYNRASMVKEAIDSILNQTFKDLELIVVDNYSTDNTEALVKSYTDKRIRYFKNQNNGFIGINRNFGIQQSTGKYIAFLDDDDLWLPEKLEKQVRLLDSDKELGLVYSDVYIVDGEKELRRNTLFYHSKPVRGFIFNQLLQGNFIPMLTVVFRREVTNEIGLFNPIYKIALDHDLWLRITEIRPVDFVEQPLAKYRIHSGSSSHQNSILACQEDLKIIKYWLNKKPELKRALGKKLRLRKALIYRSMLMTAASHIYRNRNSKSIKEFGNVLIYLFQENC